MRHRKRTIKLGRTPAHRDALLATLVCQLIERGRVRTTLEKAKAARRLADRMVTLGKRGTLAARRLAIQRLRKASAVARLFDQVAPAARERAGGYTRVLHLGPRGSDGAEMALLEWTDFVPTTKPAASAAPKPK